MLDEFKKFIAKGNVMDMAVGIIIGAAFTAIVQSVVKDLINPFVGIFTGGIDFTNLFVELDGSDYDSLVDAQEAGAAVFAYGSFINACINFLIIAFVVFLLVKGVNRVKEQFAQEEDSIPPGPAGPTTEDLLAEIRDLLAKRDGPAA
ncbi:large conductance mechanosensitive channel protein MscL [Roseobacter sp. HKCCA0434]|uniref:large conductance mechanosensitive channel protein MscL n=1 Tax=Roseobacter sp. HKCCA0434 TaxID=3079297 RepID=UPI002905A56E|nr:large conductance mechanosensitive channel protein MscL [Roseobacter sp. HKCCA0434]